MKSLKYSDVALVPKYSEALTRASCDTSIKIGGRNFQLPIIPANMKSVIDTDIASWMSEKDYFYIMHRFDIDILKFISQANSENWKNISISLGVKKHDEKIIEYIREKKLRVDFITIDIAHGYSLSMKKMIEYIKAELNDTMIIAGNVATPDAVVACTDSPSLSTKIDNLACKGYFGSASVENKGHNKNIEGKLITIPSNQMTYEEKLEEVKQDLQSAISYGGGLDLNCLKEVKHTEL